MSPGKGQKRGFWSCFSGPLALFFDFGLVFWSPDFGGRFFPLSDFGLVFESPVRTYFGCHLVLFSPLSADRFSRSRWRLWFTRLQWQMEPQGSNFQDHFKPYITVLEGRPGFQAQFNNICFYLGFPARHKHGRRYGLGGRVERAGRRGVGVRSPAGRKHTEDGSGLSQVVGLVYSLSPSLQKQRSVGSLTPQEL